MEETIKINNEVNRIGIDFNNRDALTVKRMYDEQFRKIMNDKSVTKLRIFNLTESQKLLYFLPDLIPIEFKFKEDKIPFLGKERLYNYLVCDIKSMGDFGAFELVKETKNFGNQQDDFQGGLTSDTIIDEKYHRLVYVLKRDKALTRCSVTFIPKSDSDLILDFATFVKLFL